MFAVPLFGLAGFSSAWMLAWGLAALIPLMLHLLHRHRQQTIRWAAIELLRQAIEQQSRRIRVEQILLLALRMLACGLLAIALARPFFSTPDESPSADLAPPRLWILALDVSYSMGYRQSQSTRWESAKVRAVEIVKNAGADDAFAVVELGQPSRAIVPQVSFDRVAVATQIEHMRLSDGGGDLASCMDLVDEIVRRARQDERNPKSIHVVFITDLGKDTWQSALEGATQKGLRQLAATTQLGIEPVSTEQPTNLAVTSLLAANQTALVGRSLGVTATVENFSAANVAKLPLQFQLDDATVHTDFIDLSSGESKSVTAQIDLNEPGNAVVTATIPSDRLPTDDSRDLVVLVRKQIQVLCVEERPAAARLVALALVPTDSPSAPIRVATISSLEFGIQDLSDWDAIVLSDLKGLSSIDARRLNDFASSGRGVICLMAGDVQSGLWNLTARGDTVDLFGFQLSEPSAYGDWHLDPLGYASPVVQPFAGFPDSGLLTTPIFRYWRLQPERSPALVVDLALENSEPLIVRHRIGLGWVGSFLSAPMGGNVTRSDEKPWNAIATWPSFVPLIRQLLQSVLSGQAEAQNLVVGQLMAGTAAGGGNIAPRLNLPDGSSTTVSTGERGPDGSFRWSIGPTDRRGVYSFSDAPNRERKIAVNVDPVESSLESMPLTSLPQSPPEKRDAIRADSLTNRRSESHEFPAQVVLCLLALVLIAESVFAWSLGRRLA